MAFKKGQGGRPKGVPNKVTIDVRAAAEALVDDPVYRAKLGRDLRARKIAPAIEAMLWYYAKGKPKDIIEHLGSLQDLTDVELITRVTEVLAKLTAE